MVIPCRDGRVEDEPNNRSCFATSKLPTPLDDAKLMPEGNEERKRQWVDKVFLSKQNGDHHKVCGGGAANISEAIWVPLALVTKATNVGSEGEDEYLPDTCTS
jgi:hypothetical protein